MCGHAETASPRGTAVTGPAHVHQAAVAGWMGRKSVVRAVVTAVAQATSSVS